MKLACSKWLFLCTGANSPTNLTAEQVNSTAIRVSWIPPASGSTVTGYRIFYQTEGNQGSVDVGASTTEYTITSLVVNDTYTITLVALSEHLPSAIVGPEIIIPGKTSVINGAVLDMERYGLVVAYTLSNCLFQLW